MHGSVITYAISSQFLHSAVAWATRNVSSRTLMSEIAEFPLPADATEEERTTAKREIAKYTKIVSATDDAIRFEGELIGQTGPVWHFQYTRMYKLPKGYVAAAHDLHEGIKVAFADRPEGLPKAFENPLVREFLEDELRFRGIVGPEHAKAE
jgi:hypothetical protein